MLNSEKTFRSFIPVVDFHLKNQYHQWLFGSRSQKGLVSGNMGISYVTKQPVIQFLKERLPWTIFFTVIPMILAFVLGVFLAIKMVMNQNGVFDKGLQAILSLLYSIPSFWFATLLLILFANPGILTIFPASGIKEFSGYPMKMSLLQKIYESLPYLILPTISYSYTYLVVFTRIIRSSLIQESKQEYIKTAKAKGLSRSKILYKHALKNSLLPSITILARIFPGILGGSVILETIFSIPGLGLGIYESIINQDFPVMTGIFFLAGFMVLTGYLVSDIIYAFMDPKIKYLS
jgi:peptide/nickel transport system permease protein